MSFELHHGDCLEIMPRLVERFGGIITDIPYGTTACKWDTIIPLVPMWEQVKRLLKPNGAFITTASQPFTSVLVMSNLEWFKYEWCWNKVSKTDVMNAKNKPLKQHENVLVFSAYITANGSDRKMNYFPVGVLPGKRQTLQTENNYGEAMNPRRKSHKLGYYKEQGRNYPASIITFSNADRSEALHPTQKPVALYEYLIRTYSNPGDTILDFAMGSGTTGVAAIRTGRHFVGIEKEREYYEIAEQRIRNAQPALFVEDKSLLTPRETDLLRSGAAGETSQPSLFGKYAQYNLLDALLSDRAAQQGLQPDQPSAETSAATSDPKQINNQPDLPETAGS